MDPNACFEAMLNSRDEAAFNEYKKDLQEWMERGGFGPTVQDSRGRIGTLINLKTCWEGQCTVQWRNNRRSFVRLADLDVAR